MSHGVGRTWSTAHMRKALAKLVRQCDAPDSKSCCPITHALAAD